MRYTQTTVLTFSYKLYNVLAIYVSTFSHAYLLAVRTFTKQFNIPEIATMHWTETQLYPFPDMSIQRQCIDFKAINEWRRKNAISMEKYKNVMRKDRQLKPVEERPIEQGYWDMFKNEPDTFL
jgi:hypothetical protein